MRLFARPRETVSVHPSHVKAWMRRSLVEVGCLVVVLAAAGCGDGTFRVASAIVVKATQWRKADALFHRDPRWLGSDAAYSVPLRDGRILWLFNDTLVATTSRHARSEAAFVRNTVGIERGDNPTDASMRFYWGKSGSGPASYFPEDGNRWFWPQHGIRLGRSLVVFLDRVKENPQGPPGFNFEGDGWRLAVIKDASASPAEWRFRTVTPPQALAQFDAGKAVNLVGRYVVSLAFPKQGGPPFPGYLLRWRAEDLAAGRLDRGQWWAGHWGWVRTSNLSHAAMPIVGNAGPECSLTFDRNLDRWVLVRSEGFGATTIVVSFARRVEGSWSRPRVAFRPPESNRPNANVYAAKGHPELRGADLVVTYATKTYPRFIRLMFSQR